ncbi:4-(cytidine 5'-diphospho)-2-C-methyl-D-erythritol kinase [Chryseolinea sp. T2]|uniref:4-(cytidine 5'-diphospho)-2-C-methyl-D-erythritol kinase n=1 Tax=Chryseolinea sp. T2 TaxID=3129255 RepID=UPI003077F702
MVAFPPCKINLGLRITAKRADGYHNLETCFYPVPWTDVLEVVHASSLSFAYSGHVIPGDSSSNLIEKAYRLLQRDFNIGAVSAHLHKVIPMGAGLGGGSSDGAWMLRLLDKLFELHLDRDKLIEYAAMLGSDCPFFIGDGPMIGKGRGEILTITKLNLAGTYAVLLKPEIHISTAMAFAGITPRIPPLTIDQVVSENSSSWKSVMRNDFEDSIFPAFPVLPELKEMLYAAGAYYASLSGTGSTVYGLFREEVDVQVGSPVIKWSGWL